MDGQGEEIHNRIRLLYQNKFIREERRPSNYQLSTPIKYKNYSERSKSFVEQSPPPNSSTCPLNRYCLASSYRGAAAQQSRRRGETKSEGREMHIECSYTEVSRNDSCFEETRRFYSCLKASQFQLDKSRGRNSRSANTGSKNEGVSTCQVRPSSRKKSLIKMIEERRKVEQNLKNSHRSQGVDENMKKAQVKSKASGIFQIQERAQAVTIFRNKKMRQYAKQLRLYPSSERQARLNRQLHEKDAEINPWTVIQTEY